MSLDLQLTMSYITLINLICLLPLLTSIVSARIHLVNLKSVRTNVMLSSFGFLKGGHLTFNVSKFSYSKVQKVDSDAMAPFLLILEVIKQGAKVEFWPNNEKCNVTGKDKKTAVYFMFHPSDNRIDIKRTSELYNLPIIPDIRSSDGTQANYSHNVNYYNEHTLQKIEMVGTPEWYTFQFSVIIKEDVFAGYYTLSMHMCVKSGNYTLQGEITESNNGNYLSAGSMAEPTMCAVLSLFFFTLGVIWLVVLKKSDFVCRIHHFMLAVVWLKFLSLLFNGINWYYVSVMGYLHRQQGGWVPIYDTAHFCEKTLLFATIILIGSGWALLEQRVKRRVKILLIVFIPVQVLVNVAHIIIEKSEVTFQDHLTWKQVFTIVDLICCIVTMLPIYWSHRHIKLATDTNGRSARHPKLFKYFLVIVVVYFYCTRIINVLLLMSLSYHLAWVAELQIEVATLIFFILTGVMFRPAIYNPYLPVPQDEKAKEMAEVNECQASVLKSEGAAYEKDFLHH